MSTKPTVTPEWATVPVGGGVVTPSLAKRQRGWVPGERPPAQYMNWLLVNSYLWLKWLDDGDVTFTTVGVSGLITASGGITVATGQAVTLSGNATLTVGTGAVTFGGVLGVTGLLTASGGITVPTGQVVTLAGTTTLTVGGLITANAGVTAAANQHVTISGTGEIKHGDRVKTVSSWGVNYLGTAPSFFLAPVRVQSNAGGVSLYYSFEFLTGDRIKSFTFSRSGNSVANIASVDIQVTSAAGVDTVIGPATSVLAPNSTWADTTINVTDTTLAAGDTVSMLISISATGLSIGNVRITYDHP